MSAFAPQRTCFRGAKGDTPRLPADCEAGRCVPPVTATKGRPHPTETTPPFSDLPLRPGSPRVVRVQRTGNQRHRYEIATKARRLAGAAACMRADRGRSLERRSV